MMQVKSVNLGEITEVKWRNKLIKTGIFKTPVEKIILGKEDVNNDHVIDRKYHGGIDKACYLFSADAYSHFKELYPKLDWTWGMFGENVTVSGLKEEEVCIGNQYQLGTAIVEVSQPRQPCSKLGIRFGNQKVLKDFIAAERCGAYVRVIEPGEVMPGDELKLLRTGSNISLGDIFRMLYQKSQDIDLLNSALDLSSLATSAKKDLRKYNKNLI